MEIGAAAGILDAELWRVFASVIRHDTGVREGEYRLAVDDQRIGSFMREVAVPLLHAYGATTKVDDAHNVLATFGPLSGNELLFVTYPVNHHGNSTPEPLSPRRSIVAGRTAWVGVGASQGKGALASVCAALGTATREGVELEGRIAVAVCSEGSSTHESSTAMYQGLPRLPAGAMVAVGTGNRLCMGQRIPAGDLLSGVDLRRWIRVLHRRACRHLRAIVVGRGRLPSHRARLRPSRRSSQRRMRVPGPHARCRMARRVAHPNGTHMTGQGTDTDAAVDRRPLVDVNPRSHVEAYFEQIRPVGQIVAAHELAVAPDGRRLACTVELGTGHASDPVRRLAIVDLDTGAVTISQDEAETFCPAWSPDGTRLAWITARADGGVVEISADAALRPTQSIRPPAEPEYVQWSPDGARLLLGLAETGADRSTAAGSGQLTRSSARGRVITADCGSSGGWRRAWIHDPDTGACFPASPAAANVWKAAWAGPDSLVCTVSDGPSESDWYASSLVVVNLLDGAVRVVYKTEEQLCQPAAAPSGTHVSVIAGTLSDRDIDSGRLVVDGRAVDTGGVDVTHQHWAGEDRIIFAGLRRLRTVVATYSLTDATFTGLWESGDTCGSYLPEIGTSGDTVIACVHGYERAPSLVRLAHDGERVVLRLGDLGPPRGKIEETQWTGTDGTMIEGLLVTPDTPGPHPLIVHVHGGPVWAWRNSWSMCFPYTPLFADRGYAVLHPNPRGSAGRGQQFVHDGLYDMGGVDARDIERGVDALSAAGRIDPHRVGVTGASYGGFMSMWLAATSDRFAAAAARSPVTDWISQHHTSNLAAFDRLGLRDDPLAAESEYRRRSPLYRADQIRIPVLLTAGARDRATPPEQASMLHRALVERGRDSTLVIYPNEGHGIRRYDALVDHCTRMLEFFGQHLGHPDIWTGKSDPQ